MTLCLAILYMIYLAKLSLGFLGGDDQRVLLWDMGSSFTGKKQPNVMKAEHSSNIFSLGFDTSNKKIFSAGNDGKVIVHDSRTLV